MSNTQSTKQEFKGELSAKKRMIEKKEGLPEESFDLHQEIKQVLQDVHNSKNDVVSL